jgi:hypothetical protein
MKELTRCLNPDYGVLIATSVMLFPVHGFPNDYWRFTPEGFRDLARGFKWVYTFYAGDASFPHTVAFIASRRELKQNTLDQLIQSVAVFSLVPHYTDRKSEMMLAKLANLLVLQAHSTGAKDLPVQGEMGSLSSEGWVLSPGAWIKIALPPSGRSNLLELMASGSVLQVVDSENWNMLVTETEIGLTETAFQFDPVPGIPDQVIQLEAYLGFPSGERNLIARSALGVIMPQTDLPHGLTLHSVDKNCPLDGVECANDNRAKALMRELAERGEKIILDLGCGFRKSGNIGIDVAAENTEADLICLLGFDPLPFSNSTVDEVVCRDFLEHIPKAVYSDSRGRLIYPVMQLMDEVWRVLKPGGIFRSWTPMYPHPEVFQDPTHLSAWTIKSMDYFCGGYEAAKRIYRIQACFEKIDVREDGFYLFAELRKPVM